VRSIKPWREANTPMNRGSSRSERCYGPKYEQTRCVDEEAGTYSHLKEQIAIQVAIRSDLQPVSEILGP